MLFTDLNQFVVLGMLLIIGWLFGFASNGGGTKWRDRCEDESDAFAAYRLDADAQLRESNRRIAELERDHAALQAELSEARAKALPVPAPVVVPAAPIPAPTPAPEPEPVAQPVATHVEPEQAAPEPIAETSVEPAHADPEPLEPAFVEAHPIEPTQDEPPAVSAPADSTVVAASAAVPAFGPEATAVAPVDATEEPKKGWFDTPSKENLARIRGIDGHMQGKLEALGVSRFSDLEKLSAEDEMALEQRLQVPAGYIAREQWRDQAALLRAGNDEEHRERFAHV